jgi:hypothetical protein
VAASNTPDLSSDTAAKIITLLGKLDLDSEMVSSFLCAYLESADPVVKQAAIDALGGTKLVGKFNTLDLTAWEEPSKSGEPILLEDDNAYILSRGSIFKLRQFWAEPR